MNKRAAARSWPQLFTQTVFVLQEAVVGANGLHIYCVAAPATKLTRFQLSIPPPRRRWRHKARPHTAVAAAERGNFDDWKVGGWARGQVRGGERRWERRECLSPAAPTHCVWLLRRLLEN